MRLPAALSLALFAALAAPARADEPAGSGPAPSHARLDLSALKAPPAAASSRLYAACDPQFPGFDQSEVPSDAVVLKFQDPVYPDQVAPSDVVEDLVRRFVPEMGEGPGSARAVGNTLETWGSPASIERAKAVVAYATAALAPHLSLRATLVAPGGEGGSERMLAFGAADLPPRRWTALWFRRDVKRFVAGFRAQVAQESVVSEPLVAALPEGVECYARWSPGETVSLVEVWVGSLAHERTFDVDLSPLRGVPEANSMGTATLPTTAVSRTFSTIPVPAAKPSRAEVSWATRGTALSLRLDVGAAPPPERADLGGKPYAVVRAAAVAAPLDGGARVGRVEEVVRLFQAGDAATGAASGHLETIAQAFLGCDGEGGRADRLREEVVREEAALSGADLDLRCSVVTDEALRAALAAGKGGPSRALEPNAVAALLSGSRPIASVRVPVTSGIATSVRTGACVVGYAAFDASLAERAGGIAPAPSGRFDGLVLEVKATKAPEGSWRLRMSGALSWARPDGGSADLAFRAPVGMSFRNYNSNPEDSTVRRVKVPLLSDGETQAEADLSLADGGTVLLAVLSRPSESGARETAVLLATLAERR